MDPRFERDVFVKNIVKAKPNYCVAPTSMYEGFLDEKLVKNKDLSFFNYPFEGGEPLSDEVATKIETVFKQHGNNSPLRVAYGQCECGAAITTQTQMAESTRGSVGIPLPGITIGVFDDDFNELPYYERGQILANTPCSMLGYYKNDKATEEYFHIDKNGRKWNCTGDIGYIDEKGNLFVEGRASDYSIINGEKIYNFDIENIIMELDGIKMCDVLEFDDDDKKITDGCLRAIEAGAEIVFCTGGMSVDPDDKTPLAIKNTGARIVSYGSPVLPGAMFLLSYYDAGDRLVPICGLPGCAMYNKRTIFDIVLPRLMACDMILADELAGLGEGGLCLNCDVCTFPNCGFGKGF